ncbi:AbrB family transcriptional regulator [Pseudoprimorskyibacter insulae]|uniref:Ammonia monooxygenase n=1 Tax=Pseudoprimorskyibacter insulae TaxID=1695997 RepID=A0A2R8AYL6_9RHOB|nr:AbrB family transcriptional regulator [Pseudoprimorskyibacter insulae]SPF81131.1 hypothetical protein PRI8871_02951 [Pseudoprimorskyibacter insulae]
MTNRDLVGLGLSLGIAALGAVVFWLIGFPSAALTGAATTISVAGVLGVTIVMPVWLRTLAFVLLGLNIGSGVTPDVLKGAVTWPISIAVLGISLIASIRIARIGLTRWFDFDRRSAVLAAAPGHLSYVLALSVEAGSDTTRIAVVQSIRVLFLTLCVPVLVSHLFGATGMQVLPPQVMGLAPAGVMLGLTFGVGAMFQRLKVPAAYLLAGMLVSAVGHGSELTPGRLPDWATVAAFMVMGILIGSRFSGQSLSQLKAVAWAGVWITVVNVVMALAAVGLCLWILGESPALLIVAFAPGGVEAMVAIGVSLGLDPAFVAAHHVMRLVLLTFIVPALLAAARSKG